jgi:hypothetical protein
MNPEGKLHDWTDIPEDELPELQQIAAGGPSAEIAHNVVENLQTCKGKGKAAVVPGWQLQQQQQQLQQQQQQQQKGPSYFSSSFRQVFDSRRGLFEKSPANLEPKYQAVNPGGFELEYKTQHMTQQTNNNSLTQKSSPKSFQKEEPPTLFRSSTAPCALVSRFSRQNQQLFAQPQECSRQIQPPPECSRQIQPLPELSRPNPQLPPQPSSPTVPRRASSRRVIAQYKLTAGKFANQQEEEERSRPPIRSFFGYS